MVRPKLGPDKLGAGSPLRFEGKGGSFAQLALTTAVVGSGNAANARLSGIPVYQYMALCHTHLSAISARSFKLVSFKLVHTTD